MSTVARLVRRLAALSEPRQRVAVLAEQAERLGAASFAATLSGLVARAAESKGAGELVAFSVVVDFLASEQVDDELRLDLLSAARDGGHHDLLRLLVAPPPHRVEEERRVPDYGAGRTLTLGERKALARRPNRRLLEQVLADPHPDVIRNLLRNPKLTEADVLRLVTRRPNREDVLVEVLRSERWARRYTIKLALVRNPYTPPAISLKLLPLLLRQDLAEVAVDRSLHPSVLLASRRLVEGERPSSEDEPPDEEPGPTVH